MLRISFSFKSGETLHLNECTPADAERCKTLFASDAPKHALFTRENGEILAILNIYEICFIAVVQG